MAADALATLLAERARERLVLDSAAFNDAGDRDAVASLYVSNERMGRPTAPDDFIEARDAKLAAFNASPPRTTRHICANIRVTLRDKEIAHVASQILMFTAADQPPLVGSYANVCVLGPDGWRFAERRGSLDFSKG
jgi:hypothetical protein